MKVVALGSLNPVKVRATESAFSRFFRVEVRGVRVSTGVSPQPLGWEETFEGAKERAEKAYPFGEMGVGIEAGLMEVEGAYFDVQVTAISDGNSTAFGLGPGFEHPPGVVREVLRGREVGEVMGEASGIEDIGRRNGAIGFLTEGKVTREEITEQSVLMALVPWLKGGLYPQHKF